MLHLEIIEERLEREFDLNLITTAPSVIYKVHKQNGEVIDEFSCFVNPEKPIPPKVVEVTNITDDMVKDSDTIDKVMPKVLEFMGICLADPVAWFAAVIPLAYTYYKREKSFKYESE